MATVFIAFGSNMGDSKYNLQRARDLLQHREWVVLDTCSPIYVTQPWGKSDQPEYLNQVCKGHTELSPRALVRFFHAIEYDLGRRRDQEERWGPRVLDLDLLAYDDEPYEDHIVTVPHPRMHERRFVLVPLVDIAPEWTHPVLNKPAHELLDECEDVGDVQQL